MFFIIYHVSFQEKRQLSRQAIEKGINGAAYWLEQQQKQLEGTNEIYSRSNYTDLSDEKGVSHDGVESQFINLAFEFDERKDTKKATTMQELELEMLKKHYNQQRHIWKSCTNSALLLLYVYPVNVYFRNKWTML